MTLTPLQSWLLLAGLTVGVVGVLWLTARPSRGRTLTSRRIQRELDDLARREAARRHIQQMQERDHVRLPIRKIEGEL